MLYVAAAARRRRLGARLVGLVEDAARGRGAAAVELWSDTRFHDAHRLYARLGYGRSARTRELHDLSNTVEHHFRKRLS
jgi:putative acetyltransferase